MTRATRATRASFPLSFPSWQRDGLLDWGGDVTLTGHTANLAVRRPRNIQYHKHPPRAGSRDGEGDRTRTDILFVSRRSGHTSSSPADALVEAISALQSLAQSNLEFNRALSDSGAVPQVVGNVL